MLCYLVTNSILCSGFITRLTKPLPDHGIDTYIQHERGEWSSLSNAPLSIKKFPVFSPGTAYQFCRVPELLLEAHHHWPDSIGPQNIERSFPIKRVVCLLQIHKILIEQALIAPSQTLSKLCLDPGRPHSPPWKSTMAMEPIMKLDQF